MAKFTHPENKAKGEKNFALASDNGRKTYYVTLATFPIRFQKKVSIDRATGCWNWAGATVCHQKHRQYKYGQYSVDGTVKGMDKAHRFAYQFVNGPVLPGLRLDIDHICQNKLCVNPAHLRAITHQDNCRLRSKRQRVPGSVRWRRERYQRGEL